MENKTGKTVKYTVVHDYQDLNIIQKTRRISKKRAFTLNQCGFDIETTNIIQRNENGDIQNAIAVMYHWQFCINNTVILGRTWDELEKFFIWLNNQVKHTIIIWVANLGFEMSFLMSHFNIKKCFAKTAWKPMYFRILKHIEFHDCLQVTGGNLEYLAKNYCSAGNQKLTGDLDFTKSRHCFTPMTEHEIAYCINDVTILSEFAGYIFKKFRNIPLTKTGILRAEVREKFEQLPEDCQEYIKSMIPEQSEYIDDMKFLFQGGFTHANFLSVNLKTENVAGLDITSSYPAVMLQEYFPMSIFRPIELETDGHEITDTHLKTHCVKFTAIFTGVRAKHCHTILSEHKLKPLTVEYDDGTHVTFPVNPVFDNGRLLQADGICVKMTEIDYEIFSKFYTWKSCEIHDSKIAERAPLPDYLTDLIKHYYVMKSELKQSGKQKTLEYILSKQAVNSFYGMTVTKIMIKNLIFDDAGKKFALQENSKPWYKITEKECLNPYWGVWVTAHARKRLLDMIYAITINSDGFSDAIYSDTDSIYLKNYEKHKSIIDKFNAEISERNKPLGKHFETLGTFEYDGAYDNFKTLGSKRYMTEKNGEIHATIAGVNGDIYVNSIPENDNPFDWFDFRKTRYLDLEISGKKGHHYFYTPDNYVLIDDGETVQKMECFSGCAIYDIPFNITIKPIWKQLLSRIMTDRGIL